MTRKHFQWFAEWLGEHHQEISQEALNELCCFFKQQNPRFDKWRFLDEVEKQCEKQQNETGGWTP